MADSEPVKDFYGLGTNMFEVKGSPYLCGDEETHEEIVARYSEPERRNELRQSLRDAIDLYTFGNPCLGELTGLLPCCKSRENPYPTPQPTISQPWIAKSQPFLVKGNEANVVRD